METIKDSIVATGNSTIKNAKINKSATSTREKSNTNTTIEESIVAKGGSKISNVNIEIEKKKKKSFWKGFFIGVISSVVASAIWYLILKCFIE